MLLGHDLGSWPAVAPHLWDEEEQKQQQQQQQQQEEPVIPGQRVAPFMVDTPTGSFSYDPATSTLPVMVTVFNPSDPFQRAMWSPRSLQVRLGQWYDTVR
jgi:hypothetical protein